MPNLVRTCDSPPLTFHAPADPVGAGPDLPAAGGVSTWYAKRLHLRRQWGARGFGRLMAASTLVAAPRRALLFDPESAGDTVWWIEAGRVRLSRFWPDGRETIAAVLEEGEILGQEPRLPFAIADAFVEVIESGDFRCVGRAVFEELLDDEDAVAAAVAEQIARQHGLHEPSTWRSARGFRDPRARVAAVLLAFAEPEEIAETAELPRMTLQELALVCGLRRPVLLEQLAAWSAVGACSTTDGCVRVLDPDALRARVTER